MSRTVEKDHREPRWRTPLHRPRMAFRRWRRTRPFWAGFWTLLGGVLILYFPLKVIRLMFIAGNVVWLAILIGVLIAICGVFLWFEPVLRRLISVLILLLAVVSLITSDLGGFLIGMLLAIVGGSMGLTWAPLKPKVAPAPALATAGAGGDAVTAPPS